MKTYIKFLINIFFNSFWKIFLLFFGIILITGILEEIEFFKDIGEHFLYPIFKLINVNITSFTLTMSALTTISYSLIFLGLRKIINNNLVTFLAFISIIFFSYITFLLGLLI